MFIRLLFLLIIVNSCKVKTDSNWEIIQIKTKFGLHPVFDEMDKQKEVFGYFEKDTLRKKSSRVTEVSTNDLENFLASSNYNNCKAYFKNDTIVIDIGLNGIFGGGGFKINYVKNNFKIIPYYWNDANTGNEKTELKYIKQHLILNKSKYVVGDSLFGYVYYHILEKRNGIETRKFGEGAFRAKVTINK